MLFVRAFDPILILGAIAWQLFGDFAWPARRIGKSIGSELHDLSYREFVHFGSPLLLPTRRIFPASTGWTARLAGKLENRP